MYNFLSGSVEAVYINSDMTVLKIKTSHGYIDFECYGDECSDTWIDHVSGINGIIGNEIIGTEGAETGMGASTKNEVDVIYLLKILHTGHEYMCIEYRNSGDGYSSGEIRLEVGSNDLRDFSEILEDF